MPVPGRRAPKAQVGGYDAVPSPVLYLEKRDTLFVLDRHGVAFPRNALISASSVGYTAGGAVATN